MFFKRSKKIIINIDRIPTEQDSLRIKTTLENLVDITKVKIDFKNPQIIICYDNTIDHYHIEELIGKLGYNITGIKESS